MENLTWKLAKLGAAQMSQREWLGFDSNRSRKRLPPLQTLVAFEAAARLRSFTRAADELNLTQPAVSQQVRYLEDRLGFSLFTRTNNKIVLTEQGEAFARVVGQSINHLAECLDVVRDDTVRMALSVSMLPSFVSNWFACRAGNFERLNPGIDLIILSTIACTDFGQEDVDAAVRWGPGGWDNLYVEKLLDERFILVASPQLIEEVGRIESLDDLRGVPFVHDTDYNEWQALILANDGNPDDFRHGLYFGDHSGTLGAIAGGHGFGAVRDVLAGQFLRGGQVKLLPFEAVKGPQSYYFVCPKPRLAWPQVQAFLTWLRQQAETG